MAGLTYGDDATKQKERSAGAMRTDRGAATSRGVNVRAGDLIVDLFDLGVWSIACALLAGTDKDRAGRWSASCGRICFR
jgi:hypothetical protein